MSPWTIHFRVLDKNPVLGPGSGPPFLQQMATLVGLQNGAATVESGSAVPQKVQYRITLLQEERPPSRAQSWALV